MSWTDGVTWRTVYQVPRRDGRPRLRWGTWWHTLHRQGIFILWQTVKKHRLASGGRVARDQLQPFIIEMPLGRTGVDVVAPLEASSSGNRYILVICDYQPVNLKHSHLRQWKWKMLTVITIVARRVMKRTFITENQTSLFFGLKLTKRQWYLPTVSRWEIQAFNIGEMS